MKRRKLARALALAAAPLAPAAAYATDGYFQVGFGAQQKGVAEAVVAHPQDSLTIATNPAGLAFIGNQANVAASAFLPSRGYRAFGTGFIAPGSHDSARPIFGIPALGYAHQLDPVSAIGVAAYGNGGMNTAYRAFPNTACGGFGPYCGGAAGVDLNQGFVSFGYARRFGSLAIGVAPVIGVQRFSAQGLGAFGAFSIAPGRLSNNGNDWSYGVGVRGGVLWSLTETLRFGASASTQIYSTSFDKYSGLFADGGKFNAPANAAVGFSWRALPGLTLLGQYKRIFYSGVGSVGNSSLTPLPFGAPGGPGFGWRDVGVVSGGVEWTATDRLTLRAGYAHNANPVTAANVALNILAPGVVTDHFTGGASYRFGANSQVDLAAVYAPEKRVSGPVPLPFGGGNASVRLSELEVTVGYTYRY